MPLNKTSLARLEGVHPHLVAVVKRAAEITTVPFQVTEGLRSLSRQRELVKAGASQTMRSRHLAAPNGLAHAVDIAAIPGGKLSWAASYYHQLAETMKAAARELGIPIEWGGDWKTFFDGPHYQLPWDAYPGIASVADTPPPRPTDAELRTLSAGARGVLVQDLQRLLNAAGAALLVDGDFGGRTLAAVKHFQSVSGLKADGIVGPKTWAALQTIGKARA